MSKRSECSLAMNVDAILATITLLRLFTPSVSEASFVAVTSSTGAILCSTEPPSSLFDVTMTSCGTGLPPSVQCAARCSLVSNCTNFNYRDDLKQCQLYFYVPTVCTVQQTCTHFQVGVTRCFKGYLWYLSYMPV